MDMQGVKPVLLHFFKNQKTQGESTVTWYTQRQTVMDIRLTVLISLQDIYRKNYWMMSITSVEWIHQLWTTLKHTEQELG